MRAIVFTIMVWMLTASLAQAADTKDAELKRLQALFDLLDHEQQVAAQEFQMLRQARVANFQNLYLPQALSITVQNYDDVVQRHETAEAKDNAIQTALAATQARFLELQERKQPVLERIYALTLAGQGGE